MLSINQTLSCNWKCLLGKHYSPPIRTVGNIISCYPELVSSESKVKVNFGLLFCLCFIKVEVVFFWIGYANHLCLIFNVTLIKSALIRNLLNETIHLFRSTIYNPQQFTSQMWKSQKQQLVALSDVKNHVSDSFPNMLRSFCYVKGFGDVLQYMYVNLISVWNSLFKNCKYIIEYQIPILILYFSVSSHILATIQYLLY